MENDQILDPKKILETNQAWKDDLYSEYITDDMPEEIKKLTKNYIDMGATIVIKMLLMYTLPIATSTEKNAKFIKAVVKYGGISILFIFGALGTAIFKLILKG